MKRSGTVSLVLLGTAALGMSGCKPKPESYASVDACVASGDHTESECQDAFAAAKKEHEMAARHFDSRDQCVAAYGADGCEERHVEGGDNFFMPIMMGYMLGRGFGYHPLYRDPNQQNGLQSSSGIGFGGYSYGGGFAGGAARAPAAGESETVSRGGFGSTARGFSAGS